MVIALINLNFMHLRIVLKAQSREGLTVISSDSHSDFVYVRTRSTITVFFAGFV